MSTDELICDTGNIVCVCIGEVLGGALRCLMSFAALTLMFLVRMNIEIAVFSEAENFTRARCRLVYPL